MLAGGDGGGGPAWKGGPGKHKAALIDIVVVVLHKSFPPPKLPASGCAGTCYCMMLKQK